TKNVRLFLSDIFQEVLTLKLMKELSGVAIGLIIALAVSKIFFDTPTNIGIVVIFISSMVVTGIARAKLR
ncbi:hypothetical protein, partial [Priestia megaterium]|uniref:hypothetical protein n=1 Tax=Priestia megaterium TaxID=1404 RepID=UPI0030095C4B